MKILAVFARILHYPDSELIAHRQSLCTIIRQTPILPYDLRLSIAVSLEREFARDLIDIQMRYDGLFDRARSLSLLLFEHVYGESLKRGQAMVDLLSRYRDAGMHPLTQELPDYLPLFLEFLSTQDECCARDYLLEISHILKLLHARLVKRNAWESDIFKALLTLAGVAIDEHTLAKVAQEHDDATLIALDKAYEEKEVLFTNTHDSACPQQLIDAAKSHVSIPITFHPISREYHEKP